MPYFHPFWRKNLEQGKYPMRPVTLEKGREQNSAQGGQKRLSWQVERLQGSSRQPVAQGERVAPNDNTIERRPTGEWVANDPIQVSPFSPSPVQLYTSIDPATIWRPRGLWSTYIRQTNGSFTCTNYVCRMPFIMLSGSFFTFWWDAVITFYVPVLCLCIIGSCLKIFIPPMRKV